MKNYDNLYREILEKVKSVPENLDVKRNYQLALARQAKDTYKNMSSRHAEIEANPLILVEALMNFELKHDYLIRKELGTHGEFIEGVFKNTYVGTSKNMFLHVDRNNLDQNGFFWGGTGVYLKDNKIKAYIQEKEKTILDLKNTVGEVLIIPEISGTDFCPNRNTNLIQFASVKVIFQDKKTGNININTFQAAKDIEKIRLRKFLIDKKEYKDDETFYIHDLPFNACNDVIKVVGMFYNEVPSFTYMPESKKPKLEAVVEAKPVAAEIKPVDKVVDAPTPAPQAQPEEKKKRVSKPKIPKV